MDQAEFNVRISESLGRIETKIDSLAGPDGRVAALEKDRIRNWWFTVAIAPVLAAIHALLRYLKLNV